MGYPAAPLLNTDGALSAGPFQHSMDRRALWGVAFQRIAALPAGSTSYSDTTVTAGGTYTYQVRAVNSDLASPWSSAVTVTTP